MEKWKSIPSLKGYIACNDGRVMRLPHAKSMPNGGVRHYGGQPTFGILVEGRYQINVRGKTLRVHRLVCEAFAGPAPFPEAACLHIDEDSTNNSSKNLKWGNQKENLNAPGFIKYCRNRKNHGKSPLNEDQVYNIKYGAGGAAELGRLYGVSPCTISNIRSGRTWKHI